MSEYKQKLAELIDSSELNPDQKELWRLFILHANDYEDEAVYEAANEGKDCLVVLTDNLRDKILAMISGKKEDWDRVIDDEENYIRGLTT